MPGVSPVAIPTSMSLHEKLGYKEDRGLFETILHCLKRLLGRNPSSLANDHDQELVANAALTAYIEVAQKDPKTKPMDFEKVLGQALVSCPTIKDKTPVNLNNTINYAMACIKAEMRDSAPLRENYLYNHKDDCYYERNTSQLSDKDIKSLNEQHNEVVRAYEEEVRAYEKMRKDKLLHTLANNVVSFDDFVSR